MILSGTKWSIRTTLRTAVIMTKAMMMDTQTIGRMSDEGDQVIKSR